MNSRLDWLVLSDYYSIYVTNAPPNKRLSYNGQSFVLRRDEIRTHFCDLSDVFSLYRIHKTLDFFAI